MLTYSHVQAQDTAWEGTALLALVIVVTLLTGAYALMNLPPAPIRLSGTVYGHASMQSDKRDAMLRRPEVESVTVGRVNVRKELTQ